MKPPDEEKAAPAQDRAAREKGSRGGETGLEPKSGRRVAQGIATARNACQRAPAYARPAGADALDDLARLWVRL